MLPQLSTVMEAKADKGMKTRIRLSMLKGQGISFPGGEVRKCILILDERANGRQKRDDRAQVQLGSHCYWAYLLESR